MNRALVAAGAVGFLAVAMGAFGAHALEARLSAEDRALWNTATLYGLTHAVAALVCGLTTPPAPRTAFVFVAGTVLFSGSLYALALGAPRMMGAITPLGRLLFLSGWAMLIARGLAKP